jgi:hypothetical protein
VSQHLRHLDAITDAAFAGCALLGLLPAAVMAAKGRQPVLAALALAVTAFTVTILASSAALLW